MNNREFFLARREAEHPTTLKVFEALPEDALDYRPHEASRSARELATHIVYGDTLSAALCSALIADGAVNDSVKYAVNYKEPPPAEDRAALLAAADESNRNLSAALEKVSDGDWRKKVKFKAGPKEFEVVLGEFLWFIHFGVIHHRGQLSTYIRPMGGKVPPIYGPSGDDRATGL